MAHPLHDIFMLSDRPVEVNKQSDGAIEYVWDHESKQVAISASVTRLKTRKHALELLKERTIEVMQSANAWTMLPKLKNEHDFDRLRNYEIESALEDLGLLAYRIDESCPFNGFKFFDND